MSKTTRPKTTRKTAAAKAKVTKTVNQAKKKAKTAATSAKRATTVKLKTAKKKLSSAKAKGTTAVKKTGKEAVTLLGALAEGLEAIKETILPTPKPKKK